MPTTTAQLPSRRGLVLTRRPHSTGLPVHVYRADEAGLHLESGMRYALICEEHGVTVEQRTCSDARALVAHPPTWCPSCARVAQERAAAPPRTPTRGRPWMGREHSAARGAKGYCKCQRCRGEFARRRKLRRAGLTVPRLVDATGTRRSIHGLLAQAWTKAHIAEAAGLCDPSRVSQIAAAATVSVDTAAAVRRAVAKLGDREGPSSITRSRAAKRGYQPLDAWIDIDDPAEQPQLERPVTDDPDYVDHAKLYQIAVAVTLADPEFDPALLGLTRAEKIAAVRKLAAAPYLLPDTEIARRIGVGPGFVARHRDAAGIARVYAARPRKKAAAA